MGVFLTLFLYLLVFIVVVSIVAALLFKAYVKLTCGKYTITQSLEGRTIIITGASAGIGKETAIELAKHGARLYLVVRSLPKGQAVVDYIKTTTGNNSVFLLECDFARLESVRRCAAEFLSVERQLHVLINNAGTVGAGKSSSTATITEDGLEHMMATNHFGPFLFTTLLLDRLKASAPSRIVNTSSDSNYFARFDVHNQPTFQKTSTWDQMNAYACSKLSNILFTRELARRLNGTGVTANSLHPGFVWTDIFPLDEAGFLKRWLWKTAAIFSKTPREGCCTTIYLGVAPELENISGHYFADCKPKASALESLDDNVCAEFWEISEKLTGLRK